MPKKAGFDVKVAGSEAKVYEGKHGYPIEAEKIDEFNVDDFDCIVIPGGWAPDFMRRNPKMISAIKDDVINAVANYVDEEVVVDKNLITSRKPDDLPAFCREIVKALS